MNKKIVWTIISAISVLLIIVGIARYENNRSLGIIALLAGFAGLAILVSIIAMNIKPTREQNKYVNFLRKYSISIGVIGGSIFFWGIVNLIDYNNLPAGILFMALSILLHTTILIAFAITEKPPKTELEKLLDYP